MSWTKYGQKKQRSGGLPIKKADSRMFASTPEEFNNGSSLVSELTRNGKVIFGVTQQEGTMYSKESTELLARITVNPDVMVGKPVIRGMRITVEQILKALGSGVSASDFLEDYPELEPQDIQAAILYASELIENEKFYAVSG